MGSEVELSYHIPIRAIRDPDQITAGVKCREKNSKMLHKLTDNICHRLHIFQAKFIQTKNYLTPLHIDCIL